MQEQDRRLAKSKRDAERERCRTDLFYLLTQVLGRVDVDRPWLRERCLEVQANPNGYLDLWAREHYKAVDIDTPTLTTRGWKPHGDLVFGDRVFSPRGEIVAVIANTGPMEGADCYRVGSVVAAGEHLWPAQIKHRVRVSGGRDVWYSTRLVETKDALSLRLPNIAPIAGCSDCGIVPPYVLGVWLGDGHTAAGRVTCADEEIWSLLEWPSTKNSGNYLRNLNGLMPKLREIGVLGNKHVPINYLMARPSDRLALLQGLMDTDGHVNDRGTATFVNTNERLVDAVLYLARSLGMRAQKRDYNSFWQVSFQAYQGRYCPFRLSRKRERCKVGTLNMRSHRPVRVGTRPVNCIQVMGGEYLVGDELLPTHNSTIITFGLTIQDILRDPEITVGIFSFNRPTAKAFLRQIKREFEANERLRELFPDILWVNAHKDAPKWSEDEGIIVQRKGNPKESTVEAWGLVDAQPTSKHYKLMVYDDVVTRESVTEGMIPKVNEAWETSRNLTSEGGATRYIGTRWHFNDTYRLILERKAATERRYAATVDGTVEGEPVLLTRARVAEKRREMGPYTFGAQMLLDPTSDRAQGFKGEWIRYFDANRGNFGRMNKYLLVDPASSKKKDSDYTAMGVIGLGDDNNFYLLDGIRDRLSLRERGDCLFELHRRWQPQGVGYEKYGMQADIEYFKERQAEENYRFVITELGGTLAKVDRIRRMIPIFEGGRFHLPESLLKEDYEGKTHDLVQVFLNEEYHAFPVGLHDDFFDMLSRIVDPEMNLIWPKSALNEDRYARPRKRGKRAYSHMAA